MFELCRISLRNWYLVDNQDIDIKGATAIVGATGAGKSSLEDAVQTALLGGAHLNLNKSAGETSRRSVLDYMLGYLDPKEEGGQPTRPAAETVIALSFREIGDDGDYRYYSCGIAMQGFEGDTRERVLARFRAPGFLFSLEAFMIRNAEGETEFLTWDECEERLKDLCPQVTFQRASGAASRFTGDLLADMRTFGFQPDPVYFTRVFANALAFRPITDTTKFIRDFILQPDPLRIDRVRTTIANWRSIVADITRVQECLRRVTVIRALYGDWFKKQLETGEQRAASAFALLLRHLAELKQAREIEAEHRAAEQTAARNLKRARAELKLQRQELRQKQDLLNQSGLAGRLATMDAGIRAATAEAAPVQARANGLLDLLRMAAEVDQARAFIAPRYAAVAADAAAVVRAAEGDTTFAWLRSDPEALDALFQGVATLADLRDRLEGPLNAAREALAAAGEQEGEARRRYEALKDGRPLLSRPVEGFIELLRAEGISATPICTLIDCADTRWQRAAENLLGNAREALLVAPEDVDRAHVLLHENRNARGFHTCTVVDTRKTREEAVSVPPGSILEVLETDNPDVRAFLADRIGGFVRAENMAELFRLRRGITPDGKTLAGMGRGTRRDVELIIGRHSTEAEVEAANRDLTMASQSRQEAVNKVRLLEAALRRVHEIAERTATGDRPSDIAFALEEHDRTLSRLYKEKEALAKDDEESALLAEVDRLDKEVTARQQEIEDEYERELRVASGTWERSRERCDRLRRDLVKAAAGCRSALRDSLGDAALTEAAAVEGVDLRGLPRRIFERTRTEGFHAGTGYDAYVKGLAALEHEHRRRAVEAERDAQEALRKADTRFTQYLSEEQASDLLATLQQPQARFRWVHDRRIDLENNELRKYEDQAKEAERTMKRALREDLLAKLKAKFDDLKRQIDTLNAELKGRDFAGSSYRFTWQVDPARKAIHRLAVAVGSNQAEGQALVEGRSGDAELTGALDELEAMIERGDDTSIDDYRTYFVFDLVTKRGGEATEYTLKGKTGKTSGGETQAPFYVAMAASLASAYYPGGRAGAAPSGMGLAMFDEAFNKLDVPNTQRILDFFRKLNLQLMCVVTEEKRATFTEVMDTIVTITKDAPTRSVYIDVEHPKQKAREALAAINPDHLGIEGFRRLHEDGKAAADAEVAQ